MENAKMIRNSSNTKASMVGLGLHTLSGRRKGSMFLPAGLPQVKHRYCIYSGFDISVFCPNGKTVDRIRRDRNVQNGTDLLYRHGVYGRGVSFVCVLLAGASTEC